MKVCHISHSFKKGGAGIAAGRIFQCIHDYYNSDLKLSSYLMTIFRSHERHSESLYSNSRLSLFSCKILHSSSVVSKILNHSIFYHLTYLSCRLVSHADIIHVHFFQFEFISIFELALINKPLVFTSTICGWHLV